MSRGAEGRAVFRSEADCQDFLSRVSDAAEEHGIAAYAWVLMPNHFHLLLESTRSLLSPFMRRVLTGFSVAHNRHNGHRGHVFMGRFKSILIEREGYLLQVIRYIHLNPVRAGLACGLDELERNAWSGHSNLVGGEGPGWLKVNEVRAAFGDSCHGTPLNYMDFMKAGLVIGADHAFSNGNYVIGKSGIEPISKYSLDSRRYDYRGAVLGSMEFAKMLASKQGGRLNSARSRGHEHLSMERILREISEAHGISVAEARGSGRRGEVSRVRRLVAGTLSKSGLSHSDIARFLGVVPGAVWGMVHYLAGNREDQILVGQYLRRYLAILVADPGS